MKRLFKGIAAAGLSLTMLAGNTLHMFAVETPPAQKTTAGIQLATSQAADWSGWNQNHDVVVTIPKDFTGEVIHIYPLEDIPAISAQPGDKMNINVKIVNESGKNYHYVDQSLKVSYPEQDLSEPRETVYRAYNVALEALGVDSKDTSQLTDEAIGARLKNKGYGDLADSNADICVNYLDDYYLAYYNDSFKNPEASKATELDQVSIEYRRAIFNDSTYKDLNGDWVPMPNQFRPDTTSTEKRESNVEVNKLSYDHAYKDLVHLNRYPLFDYQDKSGEAYNNLDSFLKQNMFVTEGFNLEKWIQGAAGNAYQNHVFYSDMSFTLALDGVKPEEKTSEPDLVKKITDGDKIIIDEGENAGDHATVDASGRVDFTLTSHVGEDLAEVIKPKEVLPPGTPAGDTVEEKYTFGTYSFYFVDNLDKELTLDQDSILVTVNGKKVELDPEDITTTELQEPDPHAGRTQIKVAVDLVDLFKQVYFEYEDFGKAPIVMTYSAHVKDPEDVIPGKMYNTAWVEYNENDTEHDDVDVDTFGVKVFKYDQTTNKGLQGAKFELSYTDEQGNKVVVATATSGSDGYVVFKGLKEGSYQIEEIEAPAGYVKSDKPLTILVNAEKDDDEYYVNAEFANAPEVHTGGSGTMLFTLGGGALLVIGAATYLISKKRQEN